MALFGSRYSKSGPGVSKNEAEKKAFFRFLEVFISKFGDLLKINMLYFISIIIFCVPLIISGTLILSQPDAAETFKSPFVFLILFACALPLAFTGPFTAGFTYLVRNFVRREHTFLFSDYADNIKSNFKQSVLAMLINVIIFSLLIYIIVFYSTFSVSNPLLLIPQIFCIITLVIFTFMNYYIFLMIVTFDLKLGQMYKNAFVFSLMGMGRNILVSILLFLVVYLHYFIGYLSLVFVPFLSLGFCSLIINFSSWPLIKKAMIDPYQGENEGSEETEKQLFEDKGREK